MTKQRGNILFLILLAVVLFAALSYAVTSSMSSGGRDISNEKTAANIAELMQYATSLQNTINRMTLMSDCKGTEISFQNNVFSDYTNNSAPIACRLFNPDGGGLVFKPINPSLLDPAHSSRYEYGYFGVYDQVTVEYAATGGKDLVMLVPYMSDAACLALNKTAGVDNIPSLARVVDGTAPRRFKGTFFSGGTYTLPASRVDLHYGCMNTRYIYNNNTYFNVGYFLLLAR